MTAPQAVLVLIVAADPAGPAQMTLASTARQALGPEYVLLVEGRPEPPADDEAMALAESAGAVSVAEVQWGQDGLVTFHVHAAGYAGWSDEQRVFEPRESAVERGRALGFTVASMLAGHAPAGSTPPSVGAPGHATGDAGAPARAEGDSGVAAPPLLSRSWTVALEAAAQASPGAGAASGLGGAVGGRWHVTGPVALAAHAAARVGDVSGAEATQTTLSLGAGPRWTAASWSRPLPVEVRLGADAGAQQYAVNRGGLEQSRWLTAFSLELEASWMVARRFGLVAAAGGEAVAGDTTIRVGNQVVGEAPLLRAVFALGGEARF